VPAGVLRSRADADSFRYTAGYWRRFRAADFLDPDRRAAVRVFDLAGFLAVASDFIIDCITDSTAAAAATLAAVLAARSTCALAFVMKLCFLAMYLSGD
jgi:hypothetical protein